MREYDGRMTNLRIRVGAINVPAKVGRTAWIRCFNIMANRTAAFVQNETLYRRMKVATAAAATARGWGATGLWTSPNPIFFNRRILRKVDSDVRRLHDRGPGYRALPGFNSERYATLGVFRRRGRAYRSMPLISIIGWHLVPQFRVDATWRDRVRSESIDQVREMILEQLELGRIVYLLGDTNIVGPIPFGMPARTTSIKPVGIDKAYVFTPDDIEVVRKSFTLPKAPTDHKDGIVTDVTFSG